MGCWRKEGGRRRTIERLEVVEAGGGGHGAAGVVGDTDAWWKSLECIEGCSSWVVIVL